MKNCNSNPKLVTKVKCTICLRSEVKIIEYFFFINIRYIFLVLGCIACFKSQFTCFTYTSFGVRNLSKPVQETKLIDLLLFFVLLQDKKSESSSPKRYRVSCNVIFLFISSQKTYTISCQQTLLTVIAVYKLIIIVVLCSKTSNY